MKPERIEEIARMTTQPRSDGSPTLTLQQAIRLALIEQIEDCAQIADEILGRPQDHETGEPLGVAEEIRSQAEALKT